MLVPPVSHRLLIVDLDVFFPSLGLCIAETLHEACLDAGLEVTMDTLMSWQGASLRDVVSYVATENEVWCVICAFNPASAAAVAAHV